MRKGEKAQPGVGAMKIIDNVNFLQGDELKASIHPKAKLKGVESAIEFEHTSDSVIDPEDVIAYPALRIRFTMR